MSSYSITFNGYTIDDTHEYLDINRISGLAGTDSRISQDNLTGLDGGVYYNGLQSPRIITIKCSIMAVDFETYFDSQGELARAFRTLPETQELVITMPNGVTRSIQAFVSGTPQPSYGEGYTTTSECTIEFVCPNPNFTDSESIVETIYLADVQGFDIPFDITFDIAGGTGDTVTIENEGDVDVYPTIRFNGGGSTLINPTLTNQTTGQSLQINTTISNSNYVEIAFGRAGITVLYNGTTNYLQYLVGDLFQLIQGSNTLRFSASSYNASSNCQITHTNSYITF
jgi:hypothetical protein